MLFRSAGTQACSAIRSGMLPQHTVTVDCQTNRSTRLLKCDLKSEIKKSQMKGSTAREPSTIGSGPASSRGVVSSNTQKVRSMRSRTDHDLLMPVQRELEPGTCPRSVGRRPGTPAARQCPEKLIVCRPCCCPGLSTPRAKTRVKQLSGAG